MKYTGFVEAIKEGEIIKISEKEALDEDLWILRKIYEDDAPKVKASERIGSYRSGVESSMKVRDMMGKPEYKKNNVLRELVDNFHWKIVRARRIKDITRKQLAEVSGISEDELKMIENGILPRDDFVLITKIQQNLGINLRKSGGEQMIPAPVSRPTDKDANVTLADLQKMNEQKIRENIEMAGRKSILGKDIEVFD